MLDALRSLPPQPGQRAPRGGLLAWSLGAAILLFVAGPSTEVAFAASWEAISPDGGSVSSLAVAANDPATAYALTPTGLFKTTDAGNQWQSVGSLPILAAKLIADPVANATVYAVGGGGIAKSTDGGNSWRLPSGEILEDVLDLAIDPRDTNTLFAASEGGVTGPGGSVVTPTDGGVFKSTDGGETWAASSTGLPAHTLVTSLAIDPSQPALLYAGTAAGVYKSTDAGASWQAATSGMGAIGVVGLAVDPSPPSRVYAQAGLLSFPANHVPPRSIYVSTDAGASWTARTVAAGNPAVLCIAVPQAARGTVYACSAAGLFKSQDGGSRWSLIENGLGTPYLAALAIAPSLPSRIYAGVGLPDNVGPAAYRTSSAGAAWRACGHGLKGLPAFTYAVSHDLDGLLYYGTYGGVLTSGSNGNTWKPASQGLARREVTSMTIGPGEPAPLFVRAAGIGESLFFSHGAVSWSPVPAPFNAIAVFENQDDPSILYANGVIGDDVGGLFKSVDLGATWTQLTASKDQLLVGPAMSSVSTLYLALLDPTTQHTTLVASHDGGATFEALTSPLGVIEVLVASPFDENTLYYYGFGPGPEPSLHLWQSTDGGHTFTALASPPGRSGISSLLLDPLYPGVLYAATVGAVWISHDDGQTWSESLPGLPATWEVSNLQLSPSRTTLYALSASELFRLTLPSP